MHIIDNRGEFTDFIALEQHNRIYSGSLLVVVRFISVILHLLINSLHLFDQLMWPQNMAFVFISCSRYYIHTTPVVSSWLLSSKHKNVQGHKEQAK